MKFNEWLIKHEEELCESFYEVACKSSFNEYCNEQYKLYKQSELENM